MSDPSFSPKTLSFLRSLKRNNDREWFHARRDQYESHVRQPMIRVIDRLADDFRTLAPEFAADRKISLFRPWRDTRFTHNKAPLKTHVAAVFPHRALGRMNGGRLNGAGFYFEVAPGWVWMCGGVYGPEMAQLQAIREHIAANLTEFDALVRARGFKKLGGLKGERLTRVPRGFSKDHRAAPYLQYRQFLGVREERAAFAVRSDFYQQLLATFKAFLLLCRFLNEPLVAHANRDQARLVALSAPLGSRD